MNLPVEKWTEELKNLLISDSVMKYCDGEWIIVRHVANHVYLAEEKWIKCK
jgi:hypothetical protein